MNITFMIGNGFDLGCGLKSSYADVYAEYVKTKSESEVVTKFKNTVQSAASSWADYEMEMARYSEQFLSSEDFLLCLRDFRKFLKKHITAEQQKFWHRVNSIEIRNRFGAFGSLLTSAANEFWYLPTKHQMNYFKTLHTGKTLSFSCINFNYTNIFETLFHRFSTIRFNVVHVHGSIDEDIVLGIDSDTQLPKLSYSVSDNMRRAFVKPEYNADIDITRIQQSEKIIDQSDIICIFGLKLGESDYTWRQLVLDWLISSVDHHLFVYLHAAITKVGTDPDEQLEWEEIYKKRILTSWGLSQEAQDVIKSQVHIPVGRNIFNVSAMLDFLEQEEYNRESRIKRQIEINQKRSTGSMARH